ncbi:hypothetical protein M3650_30665 [Paenibacillus sp. MER TA 81-3]|uniref:hypothetical protein n=1 Tax=Paenibacillus sp. MER TA 81-3 TaxID=2939573 RepID=UPI002041CF68|nr:hypothetical protein [Paenibacillus sp. MER TA 81-3]MCM3342868.1 hypothetical protein [Paenibacillus sp. MER TA 81-3]
MTQRSSRQGRQAKYGLFVIGLLIIVGIVYLTVNSSEWSVYAESGSSTSANRGAVHIFSSADNSQIEPYYQETLKQWQADGIQPGTGKVVISASQFTANSDDADVTTGSYEGKNNVLRVDDRQFRHFKRERYAAALG